MDQWRSSEAAEELPTLLDRVLQGKWQTILVHDDFRAVVTEADELSDLLGAGYRFHPEVASDGQAVGVWLPELHVRATGTSLKDVRAALADGMIGYARDWEEHPRESEEYPDRLGYVRRIQLAGDRAGVLDMLSSDARAAERAQPAIAPATPAAHDGSLPRHWMGPSDRIAKVRAALSEHAR